MTQYFLRIARAAAAATLYAGATSAQSAASAPSDKLPPIHQLGAVEHSSKELLGAVSQVRALPGGRLLVNDISGRKVVMFDPALTSFTVVADTTSATANAYSSRAGGLLAYKGDTSLFVDPTSLSMLVLDGNGKVARVMSVPRPNEAGALIGGPNGTPGFDSQGRLVYRAPPVFNFRPSADGRPQAPTFPDTAAIVRIDLATRVVDTVAFIKVPKINMSMSQDANGRMSMTSITNPMPTTDDWAVLADGSVAILRSLDYHVDWIRGSERKSTAKIPFAWKHLDDSMKVAFIDSAKIAMEKLREEAQKRMAANGANGPVLAPGAGGAGGGGDRMVMEFRVGAGDGGRGGGDRAAARDGAVNTPIQLPPITMVAPSELPDYAPPFTAGSSRGDADGNLWVRTSNVINGGSVYDVISGKGDLLDRVLVPAGRVIAGFAPGGVVYMGVREADGSGVRLEMARRK